MRACLALPIALVCTSAISQTTAVPSHVGNPMFQDTPDSRQRGALLLRHIGSCVYSKEPAAARALLTYVPGSKDEERWVASWQSRLDQCVNGDSEAVRFVTFNLRGAVAEGIFLAKFPTDLAASQTAVDTADLPASWIEAYRKDPSIAPILALHQLAACVVRSAPVEASRLVRTVPGSAEESAGFGSIAPSFGSCVTKGRTFSTDRTTLRALVAEALYDRYVGVGGTPATVH